ncbi:hypothetical protein [Devosia ginsengisoli]|uniref:hypothetical protein n=1 Tax=Devosia ginsengisoli TaxID=400770 RepID=UPI0026EC976C|nr:hypothetical protein [Devosia ginsengisoli]MCR6671998.1 hypothetical protein [Devosia ginsengisoli]
MTYEDQAEFGQRQMYARFMGAFSLAMGALWILGVLIMLTAAYKGSTMSDAAVATVDTSAPAAATGATLPAEAPAQ